MGDSSFHRCQQIFFVDDKMAASSGDIKNILIQ